MTRFLIALSALFLLAAVPAGAQDPRGPGPVARNPSAQDPAPHVGLSAGELTPTPEMWFYEQYQREYQDSKLAVRRKAEFQAAQRQRRMAARKWFGLSNLRPQASPDPFNSDYSPGWASNNYWYPHRWQAVGRPRVILAPGNSGWLPY